MVAIADCPTSRRSGRHIIPPLAWWTTERILIDPNTKATHIVCDSPVVLARTPSDKVLSSFTAKSSNSYINVPGKNRFHGLHVKQESPSELSVPEMGNETNSWASSHY